MLFVIGILGYEQDTRIALYVGAGWIALVSAGWFLFGKRNSVEAFAEEAGTT
jgi:histidine transporter